MVSPTFPFPLQAYLILCTYIFILKKEEETQWVDKIYGCHTPKHSMNKLFEEKYIN